MTDTAETTERTAAAELREAAETLRQKAGSTTPGRWKLWGMSVMADQDGTSNINTAVAVAHTTYRDVNGKPRTFDATYISMMQPHTALALADSLEQHENEHSSYDCKYDDADCALIAVARLINRSAS